MTIQDGIRAYLSGMTGEHHRYRSWEHCFAYFHSNTWDELSRQIDQAALQLGFYLASWGMYRGSSFLLRYTYTIHRGAIERLLTPGFNVLWNRK